MNYRKRFATRPENTSVRCRANLPRPGPYPGSRLRRSMGTAQRPDPTEAVRHQLRPLFDQIVIKELDQDRVRRSGLVVPPGTP